MILYLVHVSMRSWEFFKGEKDHSYLYKRKTIWWVCVLVQALTFDFAFYASEDRKKTTNAKVIYKINLFL